MTWRNAVIQKWHGVTVRLKAPASPINWIPLQCYYVSPLQCYYVSQIPQAMLSTMNVSIKVCVGLCVCVVCVCVLCEWVCECVCACVSVCVTSTMGWYTAEQWPHRRSQWEHLRMLILCRLSFPWFCCCWGWRPHSSGGSGSGVIISSK